MYCCCPGGSLKWDQHYCIVVVQEAHCRGINITVHAGESGEAANVAEVRNSFGPKVQWTYVITLCLLCAVSSHISETFEDIIF